MKVKAIEYTNLAGEVVATQQVEPLYLEARMKGYTGEDALSYVQLKRALLKLQSRAGAVLEEAVVMANFANQNIETIRGATGFQIVELELK